MHTSLYVSDLDRSIDFYSRFFEMEPAKVRPGYAKFELSDPGLIFSLVENPQRVASNFGHMGIQVGSDEELQKKKLRAQKSGVLSFEEKDVSCCYAKQDKFWAVDPDGIQWEIYVFHEDVEFNDPAFSGDESAETTSLENAVCCSPNFSVESLPAEKALAEKSSEASQNSSRQPVGSSHREEPNARGRQPESSVCQPGGGCC